MAGKRVGGKRDAYIFGVTGGLVTHLVQEARPRGVIDEGVVGKNQEDSADGGTPTPSDSEVSGMACCVYVDPPAWLSPSQGLGWGVRTAARLVRAGAHTGVYQPPRAC